MISSRTRPTKPSYSLPPLILRRFSSQRGQIIAEISLNGDGDDDRDVSAHLSPFFQRQVPVVLRNLVKSSPSLERWKNFDYLVKAAGAHVVCDVEQGHYNSGEKLTLPFESYIEYLRLWKSEYGDESSLQNLSQDQLLYLAQNDLQAFGSLVDDIDIPSVCTDGVCGFGRLYSTMLWLGPRGCVSPLHFDPLDNILMQIVGRKRVTLISKDVDPNALYVGDEHSQQYNTSAVDIEEPDLRRYPLFESVVSSCVELEPGDGLYIPAKWWHHVRSQSLSMSVNAWWR